MQTSNNRRAQVECIIFWVASVIGLVLLIGSSHGCTGATHIDIPGYPTTGK